MYVNVQWQLVASDFKRFFSLFDSYPIFRVVFAIFIREFLSSIRFPFLGFNF